MKKLILVTLMILSTLLMVGWLDPYTNKYHYSTISAPYDIWVDPDTCVQYIVIEKYVGRCHSICITPRLKADGTLMVGTSLDLNKGKK